jgi:nicotinamide-nucleotide adenylyltransferase
MNYALFMGRFQPFHLGHLSVIKEAVKKKERLIIAIGSAEANYRPSNPFTCRERFQMIEAALDEAKIPLSKFIIFPIRNIDNYALWPHHVELFLPPFQKIYTGSDTVKWLYMNENINRLQKYEIINVSKKIAVTATEIRRLMLHGGKWEKLVPKSVAALLKKWDGVNRLKSVQESEK